MTTAELKTKNRELYNKLEVLDPVLLNKALKDAVSKLKEEEENEKKGKEKGWADELVASFGDSEEFCENVLEVVNERRRRFYGDDL